MSQARRTPTPHGPNLHATSSHANRPSGGHTPSSHSRSNASQAPRMAQPMQPPRNQPGHAGAWLRNNAISHRTQQRRALENDPQFRHLPPQQQARNCGIGCSTFPTCLRSNRTASSIAWKPGSISLPVKNSMPGRCIRISGNCRPTGRQVVTEAIRGMRALTPEQRDQPHQLRPLPARDSRRTNATS